jgi:DNA modification methylase
MSRVEHIGNAVLHLGDCREILPTLGKVDAVVTDPPYGMKWNTDSSRFSGGQPSSAFKRGRGRSDWGAIAEDDQAFDPAPWLAFPKVVLWGSNHYAERLPVGTTLVWIKRSDAGFGSFLSDAEVAWMKGGHGVYCRRDTSLASHTRERHHPTEKPIGIMRWCIEKTGVSQMILDPFMGSGTTGVAAVQMHRQFLGIEREPKYFDIACKRIEDAQRQGSLFGAAA